MDIKKINGIFDRLCKSISEHKLSDVFFELNKIVKENPSLVIFKEKIRRQSETYTNLLKYSFGEVKDPDRDKIYKSLLRSLYKIADEIKLSLFNEIKYLALNTIKQEVDFSLITERPLVEKEILSGRTNKSVYKLFKKIWLSGVLDNEELEILKKVLKSKNISWVNESLMVSALTISLLSNFDELKFKLLFEFYHKGINKVWQRALVGIVFATYIYSDRMEEYPEIIEKLVSLKQDKDFNDNLQYVVLQILRTKETEKISRKLHEEIIPEVAKFKPKIEEKLKLDDILQDPLGEDKNPDWEGVFGDSPELFSKLEEFSKMQIEGSDVFMSAFAMLKHFDFFKEPANWFLPFYKENQDIKEAFTFEKEGFNSDLFVEGLERSAFLCNSDKYSFIMNTRYMPDMQKNMMLEMFNAELESMNELVKDDELVNMSALNKYQVNQYIQDLYRFYKLHTNKNEFIDIFDKNLDVFRSKVLLNEWFSVELYKNIGAFYFTKEYYQESIDVYKLLIDNGFNEQSAFEKIAYSYQKLRDFTNALSYYKKSELFDTNLTWTFKKIALCYRELENNELAIEYYQKAEKEEPENLYVQANLGHSYLRLKDYENALKHYFKVEYFAPSNTMILRPIAWCSFALGKFENSIKYYTKLIEKNEADFHDYINLGHAHWCNNQQSNAIEVYKKSIELADVKGQSIKKDFLDDRDFLVKFGILEFEIELMLDFLHFEQID
jgi:tetratricopeptide (TPR) repeat protein